MKTRRGMGIAALLALAGAAAAQVTTVALTTDDLETEGDRPTDCNVGVDNVDAVLVITNMGLSLFNKAGVLQADERLGDLTYPIEKTLGDDGRLFDPRADWDPINERLWYFYSEDNTPVSTTPGGTEARVHIGISKDGVSPDALDSTDWHLYTGDPAPTGAAGTAFDLTLDTMQRYRSGSTSLELEILYDLPSLAFDERAMIMCGYSADDPFARPAVFVIIPYEHGTGDSILDGDRPDESDLTVIWLDDELIGPAAALDVDTSRQIYAVQEPHNQAVNASFYLGLNGTVSGAQTDLWLRGIYYDTTNAEWVVQQHREPTSPFPLDGMDLPSSSLDFHESSGSPLPLTPSTGWGPLATAEGPDAFAGFFSSAVMTKDANTQWRIFAAHTVRPDVSGSPSDQWAVQWYVIDPKVGDLQTTIVGGWQPEIVQAGRIGGGVGDGDYYHPTIVVTQQGACYIEYTYSDDTTWPEIRRVQLSNSYSATIPSSEVTLRTGPSTAYEGPSWVDYVDMQVDPEDPCTFWSVHTLVGDLPDPTQDPISIDERDVWLFEAGFGCLNANLNGEDGVDLYDMAMFNDFFSTAARRVDMNVDGTTDATDAILYQNAYDAATGP